MATLIGRGATASAAVRSTISTPNGEERLFVNLTQAYDGRPDSPDRRVSFVLPAAHTPKPLSAARRHIKPPDPVPLNSIQAAETSTPTTPQRRISGWGDDVELIEGCKVVWNEDTRPRSTGAGSAGGGTRHGEKGKNDHHTAKEGRPPKDHHPNGSKGQYEPCPNNPALLQRSEARAASGAISPSPQLAITGTRSGSSTRPSSASVHPPHHATPSTHTPHATTTPHHPHPHAHSLHRRTPAAPQPQTDTIVPPTPHPPHHHTPSTTPGAVALPPHHPPGSTRVQTARTNLDRYRIEQIALRRLRFVVENNQAEQEHLAMVDLVEQG
ncbi:hypothetical protein DFJ77DRAFT_59646 [Powellomyces hirtus]|nr:hypothetical protein DFJ77DRAFT_59646 [Powellomyces hirtus]